MRLEFKKKRCSKFFEYISKYFWVESWICKKHFRITYITYIYIYLSLSLSALSLSLCLSLSLFVSKRCVWPSGLFCENRPTDRGWPMCCRARSIATRAIAVWRIGGKSSVKSDLDFGSKCYFGWKLPSWYMLSSRQPRACSWWHRRRAQTHHSHWCSNQQNTCICSPSSQDVQHGNSNAHMRKRQKGRVRAARNQAALIQMGGCLFNFFKLVARCVVWNHANTIASRHQQTCFDISTSSTCTWGMLMRSINFLHFMLPFNIFHFHAHKSASMLDLLQLALLLRFNIVHPHLHLMLRFNISHLHLHTCKTHTRLCSLVLQRFHLWLRFNTLSLSWN